MVQILVRISDSPGEWGLVELQGQLETREQVPFDDMHIGDLHFDARGTPNLIIGHHLLTGKVVELEKPFAVLIKRSPRDTDAGVSPDPIPESGLEQDSSRTECDQESTPPSSGGQTEYEVVALITKKIIFKNRPKPIITKALPKVR